MINLLNDQLQRYLRQHRRDRLQIVRRPEQYYKIRFNQGRHTRKIKVKRRMHCWPNDQYAPPPWTRTSGAHLLSVNN